MAKAVALRLVDIRDDLISVALVAEALRVHDHTVRRMIKRGQLRGVRMGRRLLVRVSSVEHYVQGGDAGGGTV